MTTSRLGALLLRTLSLSDSPPRADLIFVLAGHRARKVVGASLFVQGLARSILMSTADPRLVWDHLKRGSPLLDADAAAALPVSPYPRRARRQFFAGIVAGQWISFPIDPGRFGTLSEISALGQWLRQQPEVRSLIVLSVDPHLRRIRMCCRALLPGDRRVFFVPTSPFESSVEGSGVSPERIPGRSALVEWGKVLLYSALLNAGHR